MLEELGNVSLSRLISAIQSIKSHFPDKNNEDIAVSFEYLIGSFYPGVLSNIRNALNAAHTSGYIEGIHSKEEERKYKVITLCGSTRFKEEFRLIEKALTLAGNIVISVGVFEHSGDAEATEEEIKRKLDDIHKAKIDMSDAIFVINVGGYIGESTKKEIEYAKMKGKKILFYE